MRSVCASDLSLLPSSAGGDLTLSSPDEGAPETEPFAHAAPGAVIGEVTAVEGADVDAIAEGLARELGVEDGGTCTHPVMEAIPVIATEGPTGFDDCSIGRSWLWLLLKVSFRCGIMALNDGFNAM